MRTTLPIVQSVCPRVAANRSRKKTCAYLVVLITLLFAFPASSNAQNKLVPFTFSLRTASTTSAGIFKKDSTLVRTLWNNVKYAAGTHTAYWDRKDDNNNLVDDTSFVLRVLSSNVAYQWEGVIGNSSDSMTGITKHTYFFRPNGMAVNGNFAYYCVGYTEGVTAAYKFNTARPQSKTGILYNTNHDVDLETDFVATDGNNVYWAGRDPFNTDVTMVYATSVSADQEVLFSAGTSVGMTYGRTYNAAIDAYTNNAASRPSGLAVQKNGIYLFVSHAGLNELHVLNKTTGALVQTITVTNPRQLCVDMNDNLWMISATNTLARYTVNNNGTLSNAVVSISTLSDPLAIAVSPNNYQILVTDGGSSQQIKSFNNTTGSSIWTFGQAGGYSSDPAVTNNKFFFSHQNTNVRGSFIAFQTDSSFWIGDPGNERLLRFSAARTHLNTISTLPHSYSVEADRNNPTRVFNDYLEFKIDYTKTLGPNNGSWTLIRNWRAGVPSTHYQDFKVNVLRNVITLSNGKTYATLEDLSVPDQKTPEIVELPASGNLRFTGVKLDPFENFIIDQDGTLRSFVGDGDAGTVGEWFSRTLTGFNNQNNPVWSAPSSVATTPKGVDMDPLCDGPSFPAKTSSDILTVFNPWKVNYKGKGKGYHLGAVKKGSNKWLWLAAKAGTEDYQGPFPTDGTFDIGNNVEYPGGHVYALDKNILWNYHGEFWKNSQTNIWNHYYDNGLMVGQFGTIGLDASAMTELAPAGMAGNVFSSAVVKVGNDLYIYHNDEFHHSGVHRWKISGLNSIQVQSSNISFSTVNGGLTAAYYDGADLNNFNFKSAQVDAGVNMTTPPTTISNSNSFSARWSGFVRPAYSQSYTFYTNTSKGVRLWVDGNLVINRWTNTTLTQYNSAAIPLVAGKKYTIKMEINGGTASLSWSSTSQTKQLIPAAALFPENTPDYSAAYDLLEGLTPATILQNNLYGWSRNAAAEDNTNNDKYWNVKTGVKSFNKYNTDLYIRFKQQSNSYSVQRDLGQPAACLSEWKLNGEVNFEGNNPAWDDEAGGVQIDVLDDQGKVIAHITNEMTYKSNNKFPAYIKINGKPVVTMVREQLNTVTDKHQPFFMTVNSNGVSFTYGKYQTVNAARFDTAANWRKPKTVRILFTVNPNNNYDRAIDINKLSFEPRVNVVTASASGPTTFCQGGSVTLAATNGTSYLWSNNATTQSISPNVSGNYSVKVKDASGCEATSNIIKVTVNPLPIASISANGPTSFCQGSSVVLSASKAKSYLWSNNAATQNITVNAAGSYTVRVTDSFGCANTSAALSINTNPVPLPKITLQGTSVSSNYVSGNQWYLDGILLPGQILQVCPILRSGNYSVTVTNAFGCKGSDILLVPLPISDYGIETKCISEHELQFNWTIIGEEEGKSYTVEYTTDEGNTWQEIGTLLAYSDDQSGNKSYSLSTKRIKQENTYYRWSARDEYAQIKKSYILAAPDCDIADQNTMFPNPFSGRLFIHLSNTVQSDERYRVTIVNNLNQVVYSELLPHTAPENGNITFEITEISHLNNGLYAVRIERDNKVVSQSKLIKTD